MRIELDENLPAELVDDLSSLGHEVDTVASEGLGGGSDRSVAAAARKARRVLFTLDKGLGDIRRFPPSRYSGIVLFRLAVRGRGAVRAAANRFLDVLSDEEHVVGRLLVVTETTVRRKR
jgi:hypothetical protein